MRKLSYIVAIIALFISVPVFAEVTGHLGGVDSSGYNHWEVDGDGVIYPVRPTGRALGKDGYDVTEIKASKAYIRDAGRVYGYLDKASIVQTGDLVIPLDCGIIQKKTAAAESCSLGQLPTASIAHQASGFPYQLITITLIEDGGDLEITASTAISKATGWYRATIHDVGHFITLKYCEGYEITTKASGIASNVEYNYVGSGWTPIAVSSMVDIKMTND